uniref:Uncharacterized protein n=1 Tax=Opuntia streptacantha TaxID=393608 RepID=A0A7C9EVQ7_OPUST
MIFSASTIFAASIRHMAAASAAPKRLKKSSKTALGELDSNNLLRMSTGLLKTNSIMPIVLNTTILLLGNICWVERSPLAHNFADAFSTDSIEPLKLMNSTSE